MNKLTYTKVSDISLDIDLHNGYTVRVNALYNYESKRYLTKFYIKETTIDKYSAIEMLNNQNISFDGDRKTIKMDILKYVSKLLYEKYFDDSIKHYEYEIKCFDEGNNIFEENNAIENRL